MKQSKLLVLSAIGIASVGMTLTVAAGGSFDDASSLIKGAAETKTAVFSKANASSTPSYVDGALRATDKDITLTLDSFQVGEGSSFATADDIYGIGMGAVYNENPIRNFESIHIELNEDAPFAYFVASYESIDMQTVMTGGRTMMILEELDLSELGTSFDLDKDLELDVGELPLEEGTSVYLGDFRYFGLFVMEGASILEMDITYACEEPNLKLKGDWDPMIKAALEELDMDEIPYFDFGSSLDIEGDTDSRSILLTAVTSDKVLDEFYETLADDGYINIYENGILNIEGMDLDLNVLYKETSDGNYLCTYVLHSSDDGLTQIGHLLTDIEPIYGTPLSSEDFYEVMRLNMEWEEFAAVDPADVPAIDFDGRFVCIPMKYWENDGTYNPYSPLNFLAANNPADAEDWFESLCLNGFAYDPFEDAYTHESETFSIETDNGFQTVEQNVDMLIQLDVNKLPSTVWPYESIDEKIGLAEYIPAYIGDYYRCQSWNDNEIRVDCYKGTTEALNAYCAALEAAGFVGVDSSDRYSEDKIDYFNVEKCIRVSVEKGKFGFWRGITEINIVKMDETSLPTAMRGKSSEWPSALLENTFTSSCAVPSLSGHIYDAVTYDESWSYYKSACVSATASSGDEAYNSIFLPYCELLEANGFSFYSQFGEREVRYQNEIGFAVVVRQGSTWEDGEQIWSDRVTFYLDTSNMSDSLYVQTSAWPSRSEIDSETSFPNPLGESTFVEEPSFGNKTSYEKNIDPRSGKRFSAYVGFEDYSDVEYRFSEWQLENLEDKYCVPGFGYYLSEDNPEICISLNCGVTLQTSGQLGFEVRYSHEEYNRTSIAATVEESALYQQVEECTGLRLPELSMGSGVATKLDSSDLSEAGTIYAGIRIPAGQEEAAMAELKESMLANGFVEGNFAYSLYDSSYNYRIQIASSYRYSGSEYAEIQLVVYDLKGSTFGSFDYVASSGYQWNYGSVYNNLLDEYIDVQEGVDFINDIVVPEGLEWSSQYNGSDYGNYFELFGYTSSVLAVALNVDEAVVNQYLEDLANNPEVEQVESSTLFKRDDYGYANHLSLYVRGNATWAVELAKGEKPGTWSIIIRAIPTYAAHVLDAYQLPFQLPSFKMSGSYSSSGNYGIYGFSFDSKDVSESEMNAYLESLLAQGWTKEFATLDDGLIVLFVDPSQQYGISVNRPTYADYYYFRLFDLDTAVASGYLERGIYQSTFVEVINWVQDCYSTGGGHCELGQEHFVLGFNSNEQPTAIYNYLVENGYSAEFDVENQTITLTKDGDYVFMEGGYGVWRVCFGAI